ncbi:DUF4440 domain-containing protein [Salmonella enterica]|uniref:DUF4440 domain-containing protein n=1 Tax=Salmonella enterica TaxID=28901 RepID=UPI00256FE58A|nr:DUF4440 domain-containing protein [Salmonella enterica]MDL4013150.1 DUF4440 domain-containing protein [Salmonella enterica]MDL4081329.1 DUF4440 domain-containing protein [Salmonella enterica]MDL4131081.1 DUF4440 domain-containing protein [Salmonella enterica]MDL4136158.1 DUF4440 domain-containing protein [Salmonella enterica]MDL4349561.1 DUF4440 domain-containing protein [Salmonella enterica]
MNPYKDEIIHAHAAIESWLSKGMGSMDALIARFAADFTMITPGGVCLDYPALGAFFQAQRSCRPGLVIVVEHIDLVAEWPEGAALRYRERQQLPGQAETVRWSTVILKRERERIVWRHLHETTVTA